GRVRLYVFFRALRVHYSWKLTSGRSSSSSLMNPLESRASSQPIVEPLDDWVLVQPTMEEEAVGRIVLPANMTEGRLERSIVLAVGSEVGDLQPGDVVLVVSAKTVELRDGSKLVRRQHAVARVRDA
ncbi:MAG: hypothetical protein QOH00_3828, partial [Gaiellales bacterium]|nr:hypothetical protein [Gaiellales bacterium]